MGQARQQALLRAAEQCYRVASSVPSGAERDLWIRRGGMLEADGIAALGVCVSADGSRADPWMTPVSPRRGNASSDTLSESPSVDAVSADTDNVGMID
ncbi:MAG: hypothetical protein PW843_10175 [Azospirillaceae bacterium]|nr:hypothetical protein [Azospirillaceae bacterium]